MRSHPGSPDHCWYGQVAGWDSMWIPYSSTRAACRRPPSIASWPTALTAVPTITLALSWATDRILEIL